jgi:DNA-binding MarR family transcriptional regulator
MNTKPTSSEAAKRPVVRLPCACANLRRAARVVTKYYDAALRPSGLHASQFTLLQALHYAADISQKQLAELLEIDSTTLTRTLAPLRQKGWLHSAAAEDRRELRLSLTAAGKKKYERALRFWRIAQKGLEQELGQENWNQLVDASVRAAGVMSDPD